MHEDVSIKNCPPQPFYLPFSPQFKPSDDVERLNENVQGHKYKSQTISEL